MPKNLVNLLQPLSSTIDIFMSSLLSLEFQPCHAQDGLRAWRPVLMMMHAALKWGMWGD